MSLLNKYRDLARRHSEMLETGAEAFGICIDEVLSPTRAIINGRETVLAGTNNYLGLTYDPDCIEAGREALAKFGTGTTGSRIANGTYALHKTLERELGDWLGRRHVIVFSTGYQANLGMIAGLAGPKDTVFLDADSHASIYDGCTLSGAKLVRFRHNDPDNLARRLARSEQSEGGGRLVILEGIYSMLGDRPPLEEFVALKREHDFTLLVDEAHSVGVLGETGRGLAEEAGVEDEVDFIVGTFSKSLGAIGGFGAGNDPLLEMIRLATRAYMFTASPSPATIATTCEAVRQIRARPELRAKLQENSAELHHGFKAMGLTLGCDEVSPVIAVRVPDEASAFAMWNALLQGGVYVNIALPPGTPGGVCLLRCSVSAAHTADDIERILTVFEQVVATQLQSAPAAHAAAG